jgi:hypothetical protein
MMTDTEMTDDEVRQQVERADCFIEHCATRSRQRLDPLIDPQFGPGRDPPFVTAP